ncbi:hypothetical protein GQR58_016181 [Nymphon striatum]|nr:hypothetical protein GQR58_016181 [Nymphon striatum]
MADFEKPDGQKAMPILPEETAISVYETVAGIKEKITRPIEKKLEATYLPETALTISETNTNIKEERLEEFEKPTEKTATKLFPLEEAFCITEVEASLSEQDITEEKPNLKLAEKIIPTTEAMIVSETITETKEEEMASQQPVVSQQLDWNFTPLTAILVEEIVTDVAGGTLNPDKTPAEIIAKVDILAHHALSVFETEAGIKEDKHEDFVQPLGKNATSDIIPHETVMISEVETSSKEENLTETEAHPKEGSFTDKKDLEQKAASQITPHEGAVSISEVISDTSEEKLEPFKAPNSILAKKSFETHEAVCVIDYETFSKEEDTIPQKMHEIKAKSTMSEDSAVVVLEVQTEEKEDELAEQALPIKRKAKDIYIPNEAAEVEEIVIGTAEKSGVDELKMVEQIASVDFTKHHSINVSEVKVPCIRRNFGRLVQTKDHKASASFLPTGNL